MQKKPLIINAVNAECTAVIRAGGLLIFPTETLYGLGCVATNEVSLRQLFMVKERREGQPPPILISDEQQLQLLVSEYNTTAASLMQAHWPGSLTLILPARKGLSSLLTGLTTDGSTPTVGVRMSAHPVARALCEGVGEPLVATSANISGATGNAANPHVIEDISRTLKSRVDIVIDGGAVRGQPSTVVDCTGSIPIILRQGALQLSHEELSR